MPYVSLKKVQVQETKHNGQYMTNNAGLEHPWGLASKVQIMIQGNRLQQCLALRGHALVGLLLNSSLQELYC
jgi:hypothetical protein